MLGEEAIVANTTFDNDTITVEVVAVGYQAGSASLEVDVNYGPTSPGSPKAAYSQTLTITDLADPLPTEVRDLILWTTLHQSTNVSYCSDQREILSTAFWSKN